MLNKIAPYHKKSVKAFVFQCFLQFNITGKQVTIDFKRQCDKRCIILSDILTQVVSKYIIFRGNQIFLNKMDPFQYLSDESINFFLWFFCAFLYFSFMLENFKKNIVGRVHFIFFVEKQIPVSRIFRE